MIKQITTPHQYAAVFAQGEQPIAVERLCGRMIRGRKPADFETLTHDPERKIVMLMGPDGLAMLPGRSGYDMLHTIGYTPRHIAQQKAAGMVFKLAVFAESKVARPATWDNMLDIAGIVYPEADTALRTHRDALHTTPFSEIEQRAGYCFADADHAGPSDPRYMTYERFLESPRDLAATRAFLYFSVHLRELYSGDGYTYTPSGERGLQEYAILNRPIRELAPTR